MNASFQFFPKSLKKNGIRFFVLTFIFCSTLPFESGAQTTPQVKPPQLKAEVSVTPDNMKSGKSISGVSLVQLPESELHLSDGPFWIRDWHQKKMSDVTLSTVTNYDSALLLTFSGSDYVYLNSKPATSFTQIAENQYQWKYVDDKVEYVRNYLVKDETLEVSVGVSFKQNPPAKAYLNLVSKGLEDDPESRDRELFYYTNNSIERETVDSEIDPTEVGSSIQWFGAGSRYFVFSVIPEDNQPEKLLMQSTGPKNAQASLQYPLQGNTLSLKFRIAFVPKRLDVLRKIKPSLDNTVNLGFFTFLAYPILRALKLLFDLTGNYGVAIIILTIIVKILTFPLVYKSVKSMRKMAEFQPKMAALKAKHGDNKQAFNQEMMVLMKSSGYNPLAGCFPLLLQMPIFFALYSVLYAAVELHREPFFWYIQDLSAKDPYFITPVLMTLVMFLQQKLTPASPSMDQTQQKVMKFMPLMFGAFMLTTPAGLCLYMLVNAVVSVIQQQFLNKKLGPVPGMVAPL